jgi:hypothetical protein
MISRAIFVFYSSSLCLLRKFRTLTFYSTTEHLPKVTVHTNASVMVMTVFITAIQFNQPCRSTDRCAVFR